MIVAFRSVINILYSTVLQDKSWNRITISRSGLLSSAFISSFHFCAVSLVILLRRLPNLQVCFLPLLFSHYFQWTMHKSFWKISARFDCWVPSEVYQLFEKSDISLLPLVVQFLKLRIINCLGIKETEEDECTYCLVTFASSLFPHSLFCWGWRKGKVTQGCLLTFLHTFWVPQGLFDFSFVIV